MSLLKLLTASPALLDKLLVGCSISLALVAHLLPVCESGSPGSYDHDFVTGWRLPEDVIWYYQCLAEDVWYGAPLDRWRWFAFVGYLSHPLLILGISTLLMGYRVRSRMTGFISAFAGVLALACLLAFLFIDGVTETRLFIGFYLWLAALLTLTAAGLYRALGCSTKSARNHNAIS